MAKGAREMVNADSQEIAFYNSLALTWWDAQGPMWPLHRLNELRSGYIAAEMVRRMDLPQDRDQPLRGLAVLDIGCGGGLLSEAMAQLGATVTGIDVAERNIRVAKAQAINSGLDIRYECTEAEQVLARDEHFDVVLNMEVVEHVPDAAAFLRT